MRISGITVPRLLGATLLIVLLGATACGDPPVPPPAETISKAVTAASGISSMHFSLSTNKLDKYPKGLFLIGADGDVVRPDRLKATAKALLAGAAIEVQVAGVGNDQFMTDPASNRWQAMPPTLNVLAAFDPTKGIGAILAGAKDPQSDGSETIDGTLCYRIKATLNPKDLKDLSTEVDANAAPIPSRLWIGSSDSRLRQAELAGPMLTGDPAGIVRTVKFSRFDEPVTIEKPTVGTAPGKP